MVTSIKGSLSKAATFSGSHLPKYRVYEPVLKSHPLSAVSFAVPFGGGGRVVRWCWVNFQCRGVLLPVIFVPFVVVVLSFYVYSKHLRSCRDGQ